MSLASSIIDTGALLTVVYVSLLAGVGICVLYALGILAVSRALEHGRNGRSLPALVYGTAAGLAVLACGWAVVTGVTVMTQK